MFSRIPFRTIAIITAASIASIRLRAEDPPEKPKRPDIYDKQADGDQQIAAALPAAKRENKRVLLQFGANWCGWCHKLHALFHDDKDIDRELRYEYEVVLIDVDKTDGAKHNAKIDERYGNPTQHGLPALVVLDADGQQLTTQDTGELEEGDHHNPEKVLAFLKKWQAEPVAADEVLSGALSRAKTEHKLVFVYFSAPWCGWCKKLDAYLHRDQIARIFETAYVPVKIDEDRMTGGKALEAKFRREDDKGIPFFVVLDATGKKLADSNGPKGNIGFPAEPDEIEHFKRVVRQTAPALNSQQVEILEQGLKPGQ
ncbi:MAG TPA: thioredoxin family protein [Phycisphaerae bacterium]|jgi:thiol:disulfide interchange protein